MKTSIKNIYESPQMKVYVLKTTALLAASGIEDPAEGIGYGGVDHDGVIFVDQKDIKRSEALNNL